jgi:hypothetical protein
VDRLPGESLDAPLFFSLRSFMLVTIVSCGYEHQASKFLQNDLRRQPMMQIVRCASYVIAALRKSVLDLRAD